MEKKAFKRNLKSSAKGIEEVEASLQILQYILCMDPVHPAYLVYVYLGSV